MVRKATVEDTLMIANPAACMWEHPIEELKQEFASDCELDNEKSLLFHLNVGFEEANRIICFTKKL